jgi:membrane protein required for beta-lactamase induction
MDKALYMLVLFWLMMAGPGRASVDNLIERMLGLRRSAHSTTHHEEQSVAHA